MRICIDIHDIRVIGGIERFVCGLANAMMHRGHQVTCFTYSPCEAISKNFFDPNIEFIHYTFTDDTQNISNLHKKVTSCIPDIFISPASKNNHLLWCAALVGTDIPLIFSEHSNPWIIEIEYWNQSERYATLWAADAIHLLLPSYLQSVPKDLRYKCHVISNPVPPAKVERATHPDKPQILSLGRYSDVKQIHLLVEAFNLLAAEFPHWELQIWGEGEQKKNIRKAIERTSCSNRIHLYGLARKPEQQFSTADIFCIPSRFEGLPMSVLEAFTHGVPVVGFEECSGVNSLVISGQNGLLASKMTASSLAQSLRQLMQDAMLRHRMGTTAQEYAKAFAPTHIYDQWETMLIQAASRKGKTQLMRLREISAAKVRKKERKKERLYISAEEKAWMNTMQKILQRDYIFLKDRHIIRRFFRRYPNLKSILKWLLRRK